MEDHAQRTETGLTIEQALDLVGLTVADQDECDFLLLGLQELIRLGGVDYVRENRVAILKEFQHVAKHPPAMDWAANDARELCFWEKIDRDRKGGRVQAVEEKRRTSRHVAVPGGGYRLEG